jgi:hypothetical protein
LRARNRVVNFAPVDYRHAQRFVRIPAVAEQAALYSYFLD